MSDFDLETAKAQSPMLHIIPYSTTYHLYRFPPGTPGLGSLLGNIFTAQPQSSSSSSKDTFDVRTAEPERLKRAGKGWLTVTKTEEEVSIMVDSEYNAAEPGSFDANAQLEALVQAQGSEGIKDGPFGCLRIRGPMELNLVGIASRLLAPLTKAKISVLVISSYDTDFIFVKQDLMPKAQELLRADGWTVL